MTTSSSYRIPGTFVGPAPASGAPADLKGWMAANDWTAAQLAALLGVSQSAVHGWVQHRFAPRPPLQKRIEELTGYPLAWPSTRWGRPPKAESEPEPKSESSQLKFASSQGPKSKPTQTKSVSSQVSTPEPKSASSQVSTPEPKSASSQVSTPEPKSTYERWLASRERR